MDNNSFINEYLRRASKNDKKNENRMFKNHRTNTAILLCISLPSEIGIRDVFFLRCKKFKIYNLFSQIFLLIKTDKNLGKIFRNYQLFLFCKYVTNK